MNKDDLTRVDMRLKNEIKHIKDKVLELGGKKYSDREITSLIPKHIQWIVIKEDIAAELIRNGEVVERDE